MKGFVTVKLSIQEAESMEHALGVAVKDREILFAMFPNKAKRNAAVRAYDRLKESIKSTKRETSH